MRVTGELLREKGANGWAIETFEKEWAEGCEVTLDNLLRAVELDLSLDWFAYYCMPEPIQKRFDAAIGKLWERRRVEEIPTRSLLKDEEDGIRRRYRVEVASLIDKLVNEEGENDLSD